MPIKPRKMEFPFSSDIPRHWFGGSVFATHLVNGLNLLFPLGERFFVRSVLAFIDRIDDDPELLADVKGFAGQEVRHGLEHERFFAVMEAHGYEVRTFLKAYETIAFGILEKPFSPELRLAVTVALEHYTASFAERAFRTGVVEKYVHPTMRDLFLWHAAEEIEHKAVAFDVLKKVAPSYRLRVTGMVLATVVLGAFWAAGTTMLLAQDPSFSRARLRKERREAGARKQLSPRDIREAFVEYLRRDFHPSQSDSARYAKEYFARIGARAA